MCCVGALSVSICKHIRGFPSFPGAPGQCSRRSTVRSQRPHRQGRMDLELPFLSRAAPGSTSKALEAIDAALSLTVNSWLRKHGKVPWGAALLCGQLRPAGSQAGQTAPTRWPAGGKAQAERAAAEGPEDVLCADGRGRLGQHRRVRDGGRLQAAKHQDAPARNRGAACRGRPHRRRRARLPGGAPSTP